MTTDDRTTESAPAFLPATTHVYLDRSASSLAEALEQTDPALRFAHAHVAALRAAAAWLAAKSKPGVTRRKRNAWVLLSETTAEMAEWASFFAAGAAQRAAAEAGSQNAVSRAEADHLLEASDRFLSVVESGLGLTPHLALLRPVRDAG